MADVAEAPVAAHNLDNGLHIDWSTVDFDAIELPPGEDFGIVSDDEDLDNGSDLVSEAGLRNIIVVDNLPAVAPEKYDKLETVVRKIFSQMGQIKDLYMPRDESNKTRGFAFVEYETQQEAEAAMQQTNGYKLDKSHIFVVNMLEEIDRYARVSDEWVPPEPKPYTPSENLQAWSMDERGRDQFVIRYGSDTEVYWNDARIAKPDLVYRRSCWTESFVQWSPLGTYLATIHRQGAAVWGGATNEFRRLNRYSHQQVRLIDFSPGERFLVTYSSQEPSNPRDTQKVFLNIFDVRTAKVLREFKGSADDFATGGVGGVGGVSWPVFRWAGGRDDKYFARIAKNAISVYETETMSLLDKKSLKVDNVSDFSWSPTDSILALYVPEGNGGNQPARVSLVQIPSREELRQKNLFNVSECKMYWQSNGDYLAVKVDRHTKTKKSTYTGFELFRIKERDIPIEVLELDKQKNDKIIAFAWEPKGHRFAVIHGEGAKPDVSFYSMISPNNVGRVTKLATLKGKQANALYWSPAGRFIVLAGLKAHNGLLEFYNVDELETMKTGEHFMATDVDWDPTGRYVATSVTAIHQMENGFYIWAFHGQLLYKLSRDRFCQFLWRPRTPPLLSPEQEADIFRNLKAYEAKFKEEDNEVSQVVQSKESQQRRMLIDQWKQWEARWKQQREAERPYREELRDGVPSEDEQEYETEEVEVEEVIDVHEEVVSLE